MKGIILAGGTGSRLFPLTISVSKQLMPVYDKPMIYYPLSTLLTAGIRDILIITKSKDQPAFEELLGNGESLGCQFSYAIQDEPKGLAEALIIAEEFIAKSRFALILGDNIFYGSELRELLQEKSQSKQNTIFAYPVSDPQRYGVVEFNNKQKALSIEEKPQNPKSNYAVPGLYFYEPMAIDFAKELKPSKRDELEITDLNQNLLNSSSLDVGIMNRGTAWLDTGTFESLNAASNFVQVIEKRQGLKIGCIEEIAFEMGFIDLEQLSLAARRFKNSNYGEYISQMISLQQNKV